MTKPMMLIIVVEFCSITSSSKSGIKELQLALAGSIPNSSTNLAQANTWS